MVGRTPAGIADDGDEDWWNTISPAYEWMMGEMEHAGMPRPDRTRPRYGRGRAGSIRKAGRIRVPTDGIRASATSTTGWISCICGSMRTGCFARISTNTIASSTIGRAPRWMPAHGRLRSTTGGWTSIGTIRPKRNGSSTGRTRSRIRNGCRTGGSRPAYGRSRRMMWSISDRHAGNRIPLGIMDDLKSRAACSPTKSTYHL